MLSFTFFFTIHKLQAQVFRVCFQNKFDKELTNSITKVKNTAFNVEGFQFKFPCIALYNKAKFVQKFSPGSCYIFMGSLWVEKHSYPPHPLDVHQERLIIFCFLNASVPDPHRLEPQLRLALLTVIIENCSISLRLTFAFSKNVTTFFAVLKKKKTSSFNDTHNSTPVGTLALNPWD